MDQGQRGTISIILLVVVIVLLILRINSSVKERNTKVKLAISTSQTSPPPAKQAMPPPPSEETQKTARDEAIELVSESLESKKQQIDEMLKARLTLDKLEIQGRRILQETNLERECQAVLEQASRPPAHPSPVTLEARGPLYRVETRPGIYQVHGFQMPPMVLPGQINSMTGVQIPEVASRERINEIPDEVEEVAPPSLEPDEEKDEGPKWRNPQPLSERIQNWRRGVEQAAHGVPSDSQSERPRNTSFRRRLALVGPW